MIKRKTSQLLLMGVLLTSSLSVNAHRLWIKPNTTTVSGQDEWVTFDAAIANGIFHPDHLKINGGNISITKEEAEKVLPRGANGKWDFNDTICEDFPDF